MEDAFYFLDRQFWESPILVSLFTGSMFLIVFLRYFLLSSGYHFLTARLFRSSTRRFNHTTPAQWRREIKWSAVSGGVFTVLAGGCLWLYQHGYTRIYEHIGERSIAYFAFSIVLLLVGYETYYYWLHRWMHQPKIFRMIHKVHHDSRETSVFTSFSFHPLEAVLQFLFIPVFIVFIPVHYAALGIVLSLWTISAIVNHASVEIFPKKFNEHKIGRWLIGATHHDLHHKEFRTNFGLYFTFWDKWMKTESRKFDLHFDENTSGKAGR